MRSFGSSGRKGKAFLFSIERTTTGIDAVTA
jgi:hypothetical protein